MKITPETPAYNALNPVGNPLTFDADIELSGLKPEGPLAAFNPPPVVWRGSMLGCTFEEVEQFLNVLSDPYGATDGRLTLTKETFFPGAGSEGREAVILWDCDRGFVSGGLAGAAAVASAAAALTAAPEGERPNS